MPRMNAKRVADDLRIQRIYSQRCSGVQVPILEIIEIFKIGRNAIADQLDDQAVGDCIVAYVETIRVN